MLGKIRELAPTWKVTKWANKIDIVGASQRGYRVWMCLVESLEDPAYGTLRVYDRDGIEIHIGSYDSARGPEWDLYLAFVKPICDADSARRQKARDDFFT